MKIVYEAEIGDYFEIGELEHLHEDIDQIIEAYIESPKGSILHTAYEVSEHG